MRMLAGLTDTRGSRGATAHEVAPGSWSDVSLVPAAVTTAEVAVPAPVAE